MRIRWDPSREVRASVVHGAYSTVSGRRRPLLSLRGDRRSIHVGKRYPGFSLSAGRFVVAGARYLARFSRDDPEVHRMRLVCFPHVGSGPALFRQWVEYLPRTVGLFGVRLPGRESRLAEPVPDTMEAVVDGVLAELGGLDNLPVAFYGHCGGAIFAYRVALALQERRSPVRHLFVASCRSPGRMASLPRMSEQPLDRIGEALARGMPMIPPMLRAEIEPTLRADLRLLEGNVVFEKVSAPITAFHGTEDPLLDKSDVESWRDYTESDFSLRLIPTGHFLLDNGAAHVVATLLEDVRRHVPAADARTPLHRQADRGA